MTTFVATAFFFLACLPTALLDFAIPKWKADKNVHIEDAYKWLFQATRGGEHAAPDRDSAKQWLDGEWSSLSSEPKEDLFEPLCKDGSIGRLNLRPFKAVEGTKDDLLDAFLNSAKNFDGSEASFRKAWQLLGKRLEKKPIGSITYAQWQKLDDEAKATNYPAVHHSRDYDEAEHPAYRVITKLEFAKLWAKLP